MWKCISLILAVCCVALPVFALEVVDAEFGGENSREKVTEQMAAFRINDDFYCGYRNGIDMLGRDPLPGKSKSYVVRFRDNGREYTARFQTPRFAFTGGVPADSGKGFHFYRAWYGEGKTFIDVTDRFQEIVDSGKEVEITLRTCSERDPAPGRRKELYLFYLLDGELNVHFLRDGQKFKSRDIDVPELEFVKIEFGGSNSWVEIPADRMAQFRVNREFHCGNRNGIAPENIRIYPCSGPVVKIDDETMAVRFDRYSLFPGNTGTAQIAMIAVHPGDETFRRTVLQSELQGVGSNFSEGLDQYIPFPEIGTCKAGNRSVPLKAFCNTGMPVEYFVKHGPAYILNGGVDSHGTSHAGEVPGRNRSDHVATGTDWGTCVENRSSRDMQVLHREVKFLYSKQESKTKERFCNENQMDGTYDHGGLLLRPSRGNGQSRAG